MNYNQTMDLGKLSPVMLSDVNSKSGTLSSVDMNHFGQLVGEIAKLVSNDQLFQVKEKKRFPIPGFEPRTSGLVFYPPSSTISSHMKKGYSLCLL